MGHYRAKRLVWGSGERGIDDRTCWKLTSTVEDLTESLAGGEFSGAFDDAMVENVVSLRE